MHLAIVSPFPPLLTGISQYGYYVSRALVQTQAFERISVLTNAPGCTLDQEMVRSFSIEHAWQPQHLGTAWRILSRLRRLSPDVVWFNMGASIFGPSIPANLTGFFLPGLARSLGFPTIVTLHELVELADLPALNAPGGPFARFGARLLTKLASRADVVCLTLCEYVDWFGMHYPGPKTAHIPIGAYQSPAILPASDPMNLLFFTSLAPYKGLELLLEAFGVLRQRYPSLGLLVAGAPHPRFPDYIHNLRRKYGSMPGVRWIGEVPQEQVQSLFEQASLVVLPYTASTGSSSVLFQAATWGRPVVVSDLPGIRSAVDESGLAVNFFKTGQVNSLVQTIQLLLERPELRCQQSKLNLNAMAKMGPEQTARRYLQAFNLALQTRCNSKRIHHPWAVDETDMT